MKEQKYVKNAQGIAKVLGWDLNKQGNRTARSAKKGFERARELMGSNGFPGKGGKQGFLIEAVMEFVTRPGEFPQQNDGSQELDLGGKPGDENFLDLIEDKIRNPTKWQAVPVQKWQVDYLRSKRPAFFDRVKGNGENSSPSPVSFPPGEDHPPSERMRNMPGVPGDLDKCDTLSELAARMKHHYTDEQGASKVKYDLDRNAVSDWKTGKRLDGNPPPPGKLPGAKGQWSLRQWIGWFDKYFWPSWRLEERELPGVGAVANLSQLKDQAERERLEFERFQRQVEMGHYVLVETAIRLAVGSARQLAIYWKDRNESTSVEAIFQEMLRIGIARDLAVRMKDFIAAEHRRFTQEVEDRASNAAQKYGEDVKKIVNQEKH